MCGFVGYVVGDSSKIKESAEEFEHIVDSLSHRGPDGKGVYFDKNVALGHRRLAVIDPIEQSSQPMFDIANRYVIVYNGELYNFEELKIELVKLGYQFRTKSDTEVVLYSYVHWGEKAVEKFNGMFSFAVWDKCNKELFLCRDHVGIKPLYYSYVSNMLVFASEISSILMFKHVSNKPDYYGLDCYFTFGYIPAPMTGYSRIKQLLPGEYIKLKDWKIYTRKYWDLPLGQSKHMQRTQDLIFNFKEILSSAVKRQMVSDVSLGTFLSGGVDSFAISRFASEENPNIKAFSIGFNDSSYDESDLSKIAAETLNINFSCNNMNLDSDSLKTITRRLKDYPFADSSSLAVYLLTKSASKNVKVALSGDGADELLGGYATYNLESYTRFYKNLPNYLKNILNKSSKYYSDNGKYSMKEKARRFMYGANKPTFMDHASWRTIIPDFAKDQIYSDNFKRELADFDPLELYAEYAKKSYSAGCSYLDSLLYADFSFYLPNDMLVKVDRMSMANSLEVRVPFLDMEVVNFCWALPESMKINKNIKKFILREAIKDLYPDDLKKIKKSGFNVAPSSINIENYCRDIDFFGSYGGFLANYAIDIYKKNFDSLELLKL